MLGFPIYTLLLRFEATGFPASSFSASTIYIYILETDPDLVDFLYLSISISISIYICTDICCKFYMYYIYDSVLYYISVVYIHMYTYIVTQTPGRI